MISLYDLLEASGGQLLGKPTAQLFDEFCPDATQARRGQLFVALQNGRGDTHRDIGLAVANGASGVLCSHIPDCETGDATVVLVPNTIDAMLAWARYIVGKLGTKVIGVAGSIGKSVAVDAIARILSTQHAIHSDINTGNGRLSLPLALATLDAQQQFAAVKLGTSQPGEMAIMVETVQPGIALVTQAGDISTDYFQTPEQFVEDIAVLVENLPPGGLAILNYDDDRIRSLSGRSRAEVKTIGFSDFGPDMMIYNVAIDPQGIRFDLRYKRERFNDLWLPLRSAHYLYSIMGALLVGQHYGISIEAGIRALTEMTPLPGRMYPLEGKDGATLIDHTYSVCPQSTLSALDWLQTVRAHYKRLFFVFGDLPSIGAFDTTGYRHIGQHVAGVVDVLITQGTHAAITARAALDYGMPLHRVHTTYARHDTVDMLRDNYQLGAGDLVLLNGGTTSRMALVAQALLNDPQDRVHLVGQATDTEAATLTAPTRLNWIEIDIDALAGNVRALKTIVGEHVAIVAVVKADGYGHGAVRTARTALLNGASHLGVSSLQDAVELRNAGITAPILAMNHVPAHLTTLAIQQDVTLMLYDLEIARAYNRIAQELGKKVRVHLKIDTGMGRLGAAQEDALRLLRHLLTLSYLEIEGICTHFSSADNDPQYTAKQLKAFKDTLRALTDGTGFKFKYTHAANSAALLSNPETHFNMVRPGIALYGMHPAENVRLTDAFKPVMTWKTTIVQVKTLPPGHPIGYGNTYVTEQEETIAVLPVGYADGFRRSPHNWGEVLVHGQRAPLVGRVSMEKTTINVSHLSDVRIGDEVVLLGRQGDAVLTAEEVAEHLGTVNYEVTCGIMPRVPRH